jgi:predicted RNase H-like HicB family nuclease
MINTVMTARYKVVLHPSEEGFGVSCPGLPGCWSQGVTEEEALENIQDAIREYLAAVAESTSDSLVREVEVSV